LNAVFAGAVGKDVVSRTWRKTKGDWDVWSQRSLTDEPISVREQILGFKTTGPTAVTLDQSVQQFRAYLQLHRVTNYWNQLNPSLQFQFSTTIADNSMFPATGSEADILLVASFQKNPPKAGAAKNPTAK